MNNNDFLKILTKSFLKCLETNPRSNEKLKILHWAIAQDLSNRLWKEYTIKSLGFEEGKESDIEWHYMPKKVDISIFKGDKALWWIAVKFVMSNYSQNSNNYFENMLWETANLRCNNKIYYQILILPSHLPYFKEKGEIGKIETITPHNIGKYIQLSKDNSALFLHAPEKTLLILIDIPLFNQETIKNQHQYNDYYLEKQELNIQYSKQSFDFWDIVIYNDYEEFIEKVYHGIHSL